MDAFRIDDLARKLFESVPPALRTVHDLMVASIASKQMVKVPRAQGSADVADLDWPYLALARRAQRPAGQGRGHD